MRVPPEPSAAPGGAATAPSERRRHAEEQQTSDERSAGGQPRPQGGERAQHPDTLDERRRPQGDQGDAGGGDRALEAEPTREGAGDGIRQGLHAEVAGAGRDEVEQPPGGEADRRAGHRAAQQRPRDDEHEHEVGHDGHVACAERHDEQHRREHHQAPQEQRRPGRSSGARRGRAGRGAPGGEHHRDDVERGGVDGRGDRAGGGQPADAEVHGGHRADRDAGHVRAVADAAEGGDDVTDGGGAPVDEGEGEQARARGGRRPPPRHRTPRRARRADRPVPPR